MKCLLLLSQSIEEAVTPLAADQQDDVDEDSALSLHFHLGDVKNSLSEVKEKMDDIQMGEVRSRGSRGSCECCYFTDVRCVFRV